MIDLLHNKIAEAVNNHRPGNVPPKNTDEVIVSFEDTSAGMFGVTDPKETGGSIFCNYGNGEASYLNSPDNNPYNLRFVEYEKYLDSFKIGELDPARGLSRTDLIVFTLVEDDWFIIHELSKGDIASKRQKGIRQIVNTLRFLNGIPEVKAYMGKFANRRGYISACGCGNVATPMGMGAGFMLPYRLLPEPTPIVNQSVERMGFSMFASNVIELKRKTVE